MSVTQIQNLTIHRAGRADLNTLWDICHRQGVIKDIDYIDRSFEYQDAGERIVLIASLPEGAVGYCFLSWQPKYAFYRKLGIPEIQDINVLSEYRRQGIATAMIAYCENEARKQNHEHMGIGVGLDASFGPAQRLYVRLGYVPDGNGLTYDRKLVAAGEFRMVDENLCLMMVKSLK